MSLRTGVIGAGIVSQNNHLPAVDRNPRTGLVAVCDVDSERARDAASAYDTTPYTDATSLLATEALDWVHIATPVSTHVDLVTAAIDAGVPTTVQKPAARTLDEVTDLAERAEAAAVPVSVVHNWLYYPIVRELRRRIADGEIGSVRAVETTFSGEGRPDETYRGSWVFDLPGGDFEEGMPHPLYLTLAIGGYPRGGPDADGIDVRTRSLDEYDHGITYDGASIQYVAEGGALCSVTYLSGSTREHQLRVYGEEGSLVVDLPTRRIEFHAPDEGPFHFVNERLRRNTTAIRRSIDALARTLGVEATSWVEDRFDRHREESADGHYYLFNEAAKALQSGRQPPVALEHSRQTVALMEAVREAADADAEADSTPASDVEAAAATDTTPAPATNTAEDDGA